MILINYLFCIIHLGILFYFSTMVAVGNVFYYHKADVYGMFYLFLAICHIISAVRAFIGCKHFSRIVAMTSGLMLACLPYYYFLKNGFPSYWTASLVLFYIVSIVQFLAVVILFFRWYAVTPLNVTQPLTEERYSNIEN